MTARYRSLVITLLSVWLLATAIVNGQTADQVVKNLLTAAQNGDADRFLSGLTAESRRAVTESLAGEAELRTVGEDFRKALDETFGAGTGALAVPPDDLRAALGRLAGAEILRQERRPDGSLEVRVKTALKTEDGRTISQEETLVFRQERGGWRLALGLASDGRIVTERKAAAEQIIKEVHEGRYKDRLSAMLALANAWRTVGSTK
jgi:hypothetical protein